MNTRNTEGKTKWLSVNASNQVINYWQNKGYEIVYIFIPDTETGALRPKMAKDDDNTFVLDTRLTGSW